MLCYSLSERSVLGETMPPGYTQDLGHNTDRPKPVNNIFIFFPTKIWNFPGNFTSASTVRVLLTWDQALFSFRFKITFQFQR